MATVSSPPKLCTKCGRDITHDRRLKDAKGHYWCADCGVGGDIPLNGSGLISPCPKCGTPTHATHLIRKDGIYVCEHCAAGQKRKPDGSYTSGRKPVTDEDRAKRKKAILGVTLIAASAIVYYIFNYVL